MHADWQKQVLAKGALDSVLERDSHSMGHFALSAELTFVCFWNPHDFSRRALQASSSDGREEGEIHVWDSS